MRSLVPLLLLLGTLLTIPSAALPAGSPAPVMRGTTLTVLDNGLRVLVREQHGANLVAMDLWMRAGSGAERADESGAAHFLEHLLFKGTATRKPGEIDAVFEDVGSTLSASTLRDGAHFYATVATPYVDGCLAALADAVRNPSLEPEEVERERAVILDEIARGRNDWRKQAVDGLRATLYAGSRYARPVDGLRDSVSHLTRAQIAAFYHRLYAPNNGTLLLVGDMAPEAALALAHKYFGDWARQYPGVPEVSAPEAKAGKREAEADGPLAVQAFGFPAAPATDPAGVCALDVLTVLLSDPTGGRLVAATRGLCSAGDAEADFTTLKGPGLFAVYAAAPPIKAEQVESALEREVARLTQSPLTAEEVAWAKRRVLGSYLYDVETYGGQARMLGLWDVLAGYERAMTYPQEVQHVTASDVAAAAREWLKLDRCARIRFVPMKGQ